MKLRTLLAVTSLMFLPATQAHAASDATPGKLVTTVKSSSVQRSLYVSRHVEISQYRYGITGGRLWNVSEEVNWQTRAGWVWSTSIQRHASGSLTWQNDGPVWTNHWGCESHWPSGPVCTNEGWTTKWHMESIIRAPFVSENNYPQISVTVYGSKQSNGHFYTYHRTCGC